MNIIDTSPVNHTNVEHVFQIAVSVDDDAIRRAVIASATKNLEKDIMDCYVHKTNNYYNRVEPTNKLNSIIDEHVAKLVENEKDMILKEVIKNVSEKVYRSKAFKDACYNTIEKANDSN